MENNRYNLAAGLIIFRILVSMCMALFLFIQIFTKNVTYEFEVIRGLITFGLSFVGVYIFYTLRAWLHDRYSFRDADEIIPILAWFIVFVELINLIAEIVLGSNPRAELGVLIIQIIFILIPLGTLFIIFAIRLLRLQAGHNSLYRTYAILTLIVGIGLLTVILTPFMFLLGIVADIFLAMMFLQSPEKIDLEFV